MGILGPLAMQVDGSVRTINEQHRTESRNPMPPWDQAYYTETREAVARGAGSEFDGLATEGASWSIPRAALTAADLLRTL